MASQRLIIRATAAFLAAAALLLAADTRAEDTPAPPSALHAALDALALTEDDLAQPVHLLPTDHWRLPAVDGLLRRPLESVAAVRGLAARFLASQPKLAEQVRVGAEALGLALSLPTEPPPATLDELLLNARRSLHRSASPQEVARLRRAVAALPPPVREGAARIFAAQRQAAAMLRTGAAGLTQGEGAELLAWLRGLLRGADAPDDPVHRRALELAARIDRAMLFGAAWLVADAVDRALPALRRGSGDPAVPRAPGAVLLDEPTPWGRVVIAGAGPNVHRQDALLLIDLGGDDEYRNNAGGTAGRLGAVAVAIDLGGNDRYRTSRDMVQGSGVLGIGILVDVEGDDTYEAGSLAQGAGIFGVGILADLGGKDRYAARALAQGAGAFGLGVLAETGGDDRYRATSMAQGFGFVGGLGAFIESVGNDIYVLEGGPADPRQPGHTQSLGQGMGMGFRPHASGGIGLLVDAAGDDLYRADYFAQGVGFWFAIGGLVDEAGNDRYVATRYVQGAGIHVAVGVLADAAGDDRYEAHGVAQGVGHDWAAGFLADAAGDDRYAAVALAQGAGSSNGVGVLADVRGRDSLAVAGSTVQGCGIPSRGYPSIGLLLTHEASVLGLPVVDGRATRRCGKVGITLSALGLPSGVRWEPEPLPAAGPAAPRPEASGPRSPASWPSHSEKLVGLLRQAADQGENPEAEAKRRAARRALLADPNALPVLLAALDRDDPGIVNAALDLFVAMGGPAAPPLARLLDHPDARLRRRAAWVLRAAPHLDARARVLEAARADPDPVVRAYALEALRPWAGDDEARAVLVAALKGEAEWVVRLGACQALEGTDGPDALEALAAALGDAHFGVRAAAQDALAAAGAAARPYLTRRAAGGEGARRSLEGFARRHARALLDHLGEAGK